MSKILVIGLPGSGKTTQAKLLASNLGVPMIGSGELLREKAEGEGEEALRIKNVIDSGQLVADEVISRLVRERVSRKDCKRGFVMEGYPRTQIQLEIFDPKFDKVIYLNLTEEEIMRRLLSRGRNDDAMHVIKKRLEVQHQEMMELVSFYKMEGILTQLNGSLDINALHKEIKKALNG